MREFKYLQLNTARVVEKLFAELQVANISRFVEMLTDSARESHRYSFYTIRLVTGVILSQELQGQLVTGLFANQTFCGGGETEGPPLLLACGLQPRLVSHPETHSNCVTPFTSVAESASHNYSSERPPAVLVQESSEHDGRHMWDRLCGCIPQQEQHSQVNSMFVSGHINNNNTGVDYQVHQESNTDGPRVLALSHYELELFPQSATDYAKSELVTGK